MCFAYADVYGYSDIEVGAMLHTVRAIVREGKIELLEDIEIPEGIEVLVTPLVEGADFWVKVSEAGLDRVWNNTEDDVYAELLKA